MSGPATGRPQEPHNSCHDSGRRAGTPPAELSRRGLAAGVDLLVVGVPVVLLFPPEIADARTGLLALTLGLVLVGYHALLEALFGATVGKFVFGLRVVDARTRSKPSAGAALRRNLPRLVDVALAYLPGALSARVSADNRSLGDRLAGTLVVAPPAEDPPSGLPSLGSPGERRGREEEEDRRRRENAGRIGEEIVAQELERLARLDGDYHVWNDVEEPRVGNIDHLVVGPGGVTIVETKADRGLVSVGGSGEPSVDGRPLHRDVLRQVDGQRRAVLQRMGLGDVDPDRIVGYEWLICFPRGRLDPTMDPNVKRHLATARDLRWRIRNQPSTANHVQLNDMVGAISRMYGRGPDFSPPEPGADGARPHEGPEGRHRGIRS